MPKTLLRKVVSVALFAAWSCVFRGFPLLLVPGCGDGTSVSPPPVPPEPDPHKALERAVRARLGVPEEARIVAVFGMTSHWDINWLKTFDAYYRDSVEKVIDKALALLDSDPDYTYAISEIDFLKRYWEDHPECEARIRRHVSTGRLRIVGGGLTSPDTLVPPGEMLVRDWLIGNRWCVDKLGVKPFSAWQPDSFGHSPALAALLDATGYRYVSFARVDGAPTYVPRRHPSPPPLPGTTAEALERAGVCDFHWVADDGSRVLAHWMYDGYAVADGIDVEPPGLASVLNFLAVDPETTPFWKPETEEALARMQGYIDHMEPVRNTPYVFVPIGIDFAFPKSRITEYIRAWNRERYPASGIFSVLAPFEDYMQMVEGHWDELPRYAFDMSPYFMGFYTTKPALKKHQRQALEDLLSAEKLGVFAEGEGLPYPKSELDRAWYLAVRCNHHDGVTGTSTDAVYENEQLPEVREAGDTAALLASREIEFLADRVDTSGGRQARAVVVFNPLSWTRTDWVELAVPLSGRDVRSVRVIGGEGEEVPAQILGTRAGGQEPAAGLTIGFIAEGVPPVGWKTYFLRESPLPYPDYPTSLRMNLEGNEPWLENGHYRVQLDRTLGACMTSLVERSTGREFLDGPGNDVVAWQDLGGLYRLGNEIDEDGLEEVFRTSDSRDTVLRVVETGPVRIRLELETPWRRPILREIVLMDRVLRVEASSTLEAPLETSFTVRFRTGLRDGALALAIPYGEVTRQEEKAYRPTFWPGTEWADLAVPGQGGGFTLSGLGSRGWRYTGEGLLECMLHRNALIELPDILGPPGTDFAAHTIVCAIYPASGGDRTDRRVWMQARAVSAPLLSALTGNHAGPLPPELSIAAADDPRAEIEAIKKPEAGGGGTYLRIFRYGTEPVLAAIRVNLPGPWAAFRADAWEGDPGAGPLLGTDPSFPVLLEKRITTVRLVPTGRGTEPF